MVHYKTNVDKITFNETTTTSTVYHKIKYHPVGRYIRRIGFYIETILYFYISNYQVIYFLQQRSVKLSRKIGLYG